jgi:succinate-semialdehyde dehydrogenase/glutarate-semialdehyde dehydrogenase
MKKVENFIAGEWQPASETMPAINPSNGETIALLPKSGRAEAARAVAAAKSAARDWAAVPVYERAALCNAIGAAVDAARDSLARTLSQEQGKVLAEAKGEVAKAADGFRLAAELAKQMGGQTFPTEDSTKLAFTIRQPRGVYGIITPWNYPVNIPVEYLGPGIVTGNTIVWVPAPSTSLIAAELMAVIASAGLPSGVLNLVIGEGAVAGDAVVTDPDVVALGFTGSAATGRRIAERGAGKPMLLELGGNGPLLVFEDADIDRAAQAAARGAFGNAGQICAATGRVLAHRAIAEPLARKIVEYAGNHVLGDAFQQGVTMGPLNNPGVATKVAEHVEDARAQGATVLCGGRARSDLGSGLFYEPTVLTGVTTKMRVFREETFGPVVPITEFADEDEALDLALDTDYGLCVGIFSADTARAIRIAKAIPAGIVNINDATTYWEIHLPFGGGSGTRSGIGRLGGMRTMEAMTEVKMITLAV